jgi:hypothetical protein
MEQMPKLQITQSLWNELYCQLEIRGKGQTESGAFLLGKQGQPLVEEVLYYDDLEPGCLDSGAIHITFKAFIALSDYCILKAYEVKADIHTHPWNITRQSDIDEENPMIKIKGHLALIVPYLALPERCDMNNLGIHEFQGNGFNWKSYQFKDRVVEIV